MYEAYLNNKFTNALVFYTMILVLLIISPYLFIWKLINTILSCLRYSENMSRKVVLITGASSGLGEHMAYEYAKRGACLAIVATNRSRGRLEQVADRAHELGSPHVLIMFADVSKVEECKTFVDNTVKCFGRLDHLVNNAGIAPVYSTDIDVTKFAPVMDVNFWGSIYPTHFAIPHLKKSHGKIIVNASVFGVVHPPGSGFYGASKAALISFYESLRFEVSPTIKITILTLGFIQTNIITAKNSIAGIGVHLENDIGTILPVMGVEPCVKAIVDGVCKGATFITEPKFFKILFLIKFLFPELHDLYLNKYLLPRLQRLKRR